LPLAGGVIHQRNQADARVLQERGKQVAHIGRRQFAAHMQAMLRTQCTTLFGMAD
jgi:hypothetical protein